VIVSLSLPLFLAYLLIRGSLMRGEAILEANAFPGNKALLSAVQKSQHYPFSKRSMRHADECSSQGQEKRKSGYSRAYPVARHSMENRRRRNIDVCSNRRPNEYQKEL
jgi:hypothetical protein